MGDVALKPFFLYLFCICCFLLCAFIDRCTYPHRYPYSYFVLKLESMSAGNNRHHWASSPNTSEAETCSRILREAQVPPHLLRLQTIVEPLAYRGQRCRTVDLTHRRPDLKALALPARFMPILFVGRPCAWTVLPAPVHNCC